jgi:hypothetical protein
MLLAAARLAGAADQEMFEISFEAVLLGQAFFDIQKNVLAAIYGLAAFMTDQMMVMAFLGMMIDEMAIHLAFDHAARVFQNIQSAVDSRFVDSPQLLLDFGDDILSGQVFRGIMDNINYEPPLGRQFVAFFL